MKKDMSCS